MPEYLQLLESLGGVLENIFLPGDTHVGNDNKSFKGVIGRNSLPNMNLTGVVLLDSALEAGDIEFEWTVLCTSIAEAGIWSCSRMVVSADSGPSS